MIRGILLVLTSTIALLIAGAYSAAQDSGTTKGPSPGTISVTPGDSGQFRIVWGNRLKSDPDNWIIRRTIGTDFVTIQVPGSTKSYVDRPNVPTGKTLSYSVWALVNGQEDYYQTTTPKSATPQATAVFCEDVKNLDSTLWKPIGGTWIVQNGAIVQKDDGALTVGHPGIKALIFKNSAAATSVQITAALQVNLAANGAQQKVSKAKNDAITAAAKAAADATAADTASKAATKAAADAAAAKSSLDGALADSKTAVTTDQAAADKAAKDLAAANADWAKACAVADTAKKADDDATKAQKTAADALDKACAAVAKAQADDDAAAKAQKTADDDLTKAKDAATKAKADDDAAAKAQKTADDDLTKAKDAATKAKADDDAAAKKQSDADAALRADSNNATLKKAKADADKAKTATADALTKANSAAADAQKVKDVADKAKAATADALAKANSAATAAKAVADAADKAKTATADALTKANSAAADAKKAADTAATAKKTADDAVVQDNAAVASLTKSDTDAAAAKAVADALAKQAAKALTDATNTAKTKADAAAGLPSFNKDILARVGVGFATNNIDGKGIAWILQADQGQVSAQFIYDGVQSGKSLQFDSGWQDGAKYWLKLKLDTGGGKTILYGKAWPDSATEPGDWELIQDDWTWPPTEASPLLPSLCGGIYLDGTNQVSVSFDNICIEAFGTTTTTSLDGRAPYGPLNHPLPLLREPGMDDSVQVPTVALKPLTIGQWGTLLGYVAPDEPLHVPCLTTPCPWRISYAAGSCCGPDRSSSSPVMMLDPASTTVVPVDGPAIPDPGLAPPLHPQPIMPHHALDPNEKAPTSAMSRGTVIRAGYLRFADEAQDESVPPPATTQPRSTPLPSIPIPNTPEPVIPPPSTDPTSHQPTGAEPPNSQPTTVAPPNIPRPEQPATPAAADPVWSADPGNTVPPARALRSQWTTRRELRNFGAVATVPDADGYDRPGAYASATWQTDRVPHDPFSYRPRVDIIPLPPPRSANQPGVSTSSRVDSTPDVDEITDSPSGRVWTYHFDLPARFPRTSFGAACCAFEGEGAIIHEGMRLLARQDGQYEVRFNITAPSMPVLLRLQLILFEEGNSLPPRTLTLPPIPLKPWGTDPYPETTQAGIDPVSYLVSVRGYSQVIKEIQYKEGFGNPAERRRPPVPNHLLLVKRVGSARFGSGFQAQSNQ